MSETEMRISAVIGQLVPKLSEEQKERFLCFAEGMAAMADAMKLNRDARTAS